MRKSLFLRRNYNNLGKCGGNVGKSHFWRRNYGKLSFFEGGIITTSASVKVAVVVVVAVALLNYCEFRHGCTSSRLLRISSWLQVG
jgi:hypothetical protein